MTAADVMEGEVDNYCDKVRACPCFQKERPTDESGGTVWAGVPQTAGGQPARQEAGSLSSNGIGRQSGCVGCGDDRAGGNKLITRRQRLTVCTRWALARCANIMRA